MVGGLLALLGAASLAYGFAELRPRLSAAAAPTPTVPQTDPGVVPSGPQLREVGRVSREALRTIEAQNVKIAELEKRVNRDLETWRDHNKDIQEIARLQKSQNEMIDQVVAQHDLSKKCLASALKPNTDMFRTCQATKKLWQVDDDGAILVLR
jgi:hypothetical protein